LILFYEPNKIYLLLGLLASIVVGLGGYLLHFLSQGIGGEIKLLEKVPLLRASAGHFLAVFGAAFYIKGHYGLKLFFQKTSGPLANFLLE